MSFTYMTYEDRKKLEVLYLAGLSLPEISKKLDIHLATIYRDLRRGSTGEIDVNGRDEYKADLAQRRLLMAFKCRGKRKIVKEG